MKVGYAIGATIGAALLGLLVMWVLVSLQSHQQNGCGEVKPANLRAQHAQKQKRSE